MIKIINWKTGWKKRLLQLHRVLFIVLGVMMLIWFISGIVMMYAKFPKVYRTAAGRISKMPVIQAEKVRLTFSQALSASGIGKPLTAARLGTLTGRPAYFFLPRGGKWITVFADTGEPLSAVSPEFAAASAREFSGLSSLRKIEGVDTPDQWTVGRGSGRAYWPFYKFRSDDPAGTEIYVSKASGEVCQMTTRKIRILNWMGAIPHWIYLTALRKHIGLWDTMIIGISVICIAACLAGLIIGSAWVRIRRTGKKQRFSPFKGWRGVHHLLGLTFGLTALAWIFSGLMSVNPGNWHTSNRPAPKQKIRFSGGDLNSALFTVHPAAALNRFKDELQPKLLKPVLIGGKPFYVCMESRSETRLIPADDLNNIKPAKRFDDGLMLTAAKSMMPDARIRETAFLEKPDFYFRNRKGGALPVLRVKYDDPGSTWVYIRASTGAIVSIYDKPGRINRWLYSFLHCYDLPFLMEHRVLRDGLMLIFLTGGACLCLTGMTVIFRRQKKG